MRTPPSIRSDNSIRSAPDLFAGINIEPRMRRLLGEVELCLLWEKVIFKRFLMYLFWQFIIQANAADSTFGEWWCPSEKVGPASSSPSTVVDIVTRDLASWRAKYASFIERGRFSLPHTHDITRLMVFRRIWNRARFSLPILSVLPQYLRRLSLYACQWYWQERSTSENNVRSRYRYALLAPKIESCGSRESSVH